jgi:methylated-DNA-[protein]-cysteine S-methyltransferase
MANMKYMKYLFYYDSPVGTLGIIEDNQKISNVFFKDGKKAERYTNGSIAEKKTPLIQKTISQFEEYFKGKRKVFDIPLALEGTKFQLSVWKALQKIPYGRTVSYKEIAAAAGNPKACRAAGMANNRNPVAIIVPCHRVIGADGSLTGYGGGLDKKVFLLELEKT